MDGNSDELSIHDENESHKQFSEPVREYQKRVIDIITCLFEQEEELQKRPPAESLQNAKFAQLLDEYSSHDKFITKFSEYCHVIMKCKEDGQEMKDEEGLFSEEDRDEIGIQLDAMLVCYEKLRILIYDRLHSLRAILEDRQQTQIEQFEEGLARFERQIANITSIGPDYESVQKQLKEVDNLSAMLAKQQDMLNFISNVVSVIFDDVNPISLQIRSRSCSRLDLKLDSINYRWKEICRLVEDRNNRLQHAQSIWKILNVEGMLFSDGLKTIEKSMQEMFELANNITDTQADKVFIDKLRARSHKINDEISRQQSFYTMLEERIKVEIEKIDNPNDELCSLLIQELSSHLDYMQIDWDKMMKSKRTLEYRLQLLENPQTQEQTNYLNMIPIPDSITSRSKNDIRFGDLPQADMKNDLVEQNLRLSNKDPTLESLNESQSWDKQFNNSNSLGKDLDISVSSDSKSFLYNNQIRQNENLYGNNTISTLNDSQDELSTTSLTTSYPSNNATNLTNHASNQLSNEQSIRQHHHNSESNFMTNILRDRMHLNEPQNYLQMNPSIPNEHNNGIEDHNCRVEEWKDSLESFSSWLRQVETSLDIAPSSVNSILETNRQNQTSYSRLDPYSQLLRLYDIESQIVKSCQDEFDCLLLQGTEIIEDLVPEIGETECESYSNKLKAILSDLELRYATVKKCLQNKKQELLNENRWSRLLDKLNIGCSYLIKQLSEIIPETSIGVDLITLAQQQDQLMHIKAELDENDMIQSSIEHSELFLKVCDFLQNQASNQQTSVQTQLTNDINSTFIDDNTRISFKNLKDDIEKQRDSLLIHCSELSHTIEERLQRLDDVHKEMHALQHKMQELASKLQVAEILKSNWVAVDDLSIEELSEQLEDLKIYRERVNEIELVHQSMNSTLDWMTELEVPLSQQNLNRISELNDVWNLIQISIEERQKSIEQAFDNQSSSEQRFLNQTIADLPRWERRVATSKVPYFIDHETNKTHWDHPKFDEMLKAMSGVKQYIFSAYRTALKLRMLQKKLGIDMLMLEQLKEIVEPKKSSLTISKGDGVLEQQVQISNANDTLIGVEQVIKYLKIIYMKIQSEERNSLDVPLSIDLTLNWLLNLYDSTRTGYISMLSFKVGLTLICCATREEKYIYMYELVANQRTSNVDARKLGTLFETCMRVPIYLGEGESFGGSEIIETSIRNCFSMSKFNPHNPNCIDLNDYLNWLKSEPQFIIWLPVLHRILISEHVSHQIRCKLCGANPIIGLRYRCLKCFKFNICQNCFLTGRNIHEHFDPSKHPMQEYCTTTTSGEDVKDLTKILKNKLKPKPFLKRNLK